MKTIQYCPVCGKRCYNKREAQTTLNMFHSRTAYTSAGRKHYVKKDMKRIPKRIYYCEDCGYWHLTSKDRKNNRRKHGK